jgi:hypothetical protein
MLAICSAEEKRLGRRFIIGFTVILKRFLL